MEVRIRNSVVHVLIQDEPLIRNWTDLYDSLGLHGSKVQLQTQFNTRSITVSQLFNDILAEWISGNKTSATVENLSHILHDLGFAWAAEKILSCQENLPRQPVTPSSRPRKFSYIPFALGVIVLLVLLFLIYYFFFTIGNQNQIIFNVPPVVINFHGRSKELMELQSLFYSRATTPLVKVIGMKGVGKTELVKQFAQINSKRANCVWVNGNDESSLLNSTLGFGKLLNASTTENNETRRASDIFVNTEAVIKNMNQYPTIVIVDNVEFMDEERTILFKTLKSLSYFIIVTSTKLSVLDFAGEMIKLDVLETADAIQLVKSVIRTDNEAEDDILSLCTQLHNFPLALQQASAYIKRKKIGSGWGNSYTISKYLETENLLNVLKHPLDKIFYDYDHTSMDTFTISIDQINTTAEEGHLAAEVLNMMSYFEPDRIPLNLVKKMCTENVSHPGVTKKICHDAILLLKEHSLVRIENNYIAVHRLLQCVTRVKFSSSANEAEILAKWISIVNVLMFKFTSDEIIHVLSLSNHSSRYSGLVKQFHNLHIGISFTSKGKSKCRNLLAFVNTKCVLLTMGDNHKHKYVIGSQTESVFECHEKFDSVPEGGSIVYNNLHLSLGPIYKQHTSMNHTISVVLYDLDRSDEAIELYQRVLQTRRTVLGENHKSTVFMKLEIAKLWTQQKNYWAAMVFYEEVLQWQLQYADAHHPETLTIKYNIALCFLERGFFHRAKVLFQHVWKFRVGEIQEHYFHILEMKYKIAMSLRFEDDDRALALLEQVLVLQEDVFEPGHPNTVTTMNEIGGIKQGSPGSRILACLRALGFLLFPFAVCTFRRARFMRLLLIWCLCFGIWLSCLDILWVLGMFNFCKGVWKHLMLNKYNTLR